MATWLTLPDLSLLFPLLCSAQQSTFAVATLQIADETFTVATLQIADEIWSGAPTSTIFKGSVSTSINNSVIVTAYTIPCGNFRVCTGGDNLGFTVTTGSTTYDLGEHGTLVCGATDNGPGFSGTAICTETAPYGKLYTAGVSELTSTESNSYAIYFASMDPDLASSLGATTTTYNPISTATTSATAALTAAMTTNSLTESSVTTSTSASTSTSITTSASSASTSTAQVAKTTSSSPTSPATGSHNLTEHEKIGVGVGIVAFVLVCCVAGFVLKSYRPKRRAANPNPSELYFNTDEKGQASGT